MASITFAKLESSRPRPGNVDFEATVNVTFAPHEVSSLWEIEMQLWEDDLRNDDKLGRPVRRSFTAADQTMTVKLGHRLPVRTVNTEWGDEEVYGAITIRPLNPPPAFITATAKTGIEVVNV